MLVLSDVEEPDAPMSIMGVDFVCEIKYLYSRASETCFSLYTIRNFVSAQMTLSQGVDYQLMVVLWLLKIYYHWILQDLKCAYKHWEKTACVQWIPSAYIIPSSCSEPFLWVMIVLLIFETKVKYNWYLFSFSHFYFSFLFAKMWFNYNLAKFLWLSFNSESIKENFCFTVFHHLKWIKWIILLILEKMVWTLNKPTTIF